MAADTLFDRFYHHTHEEMSGRDPGHLRAAAASVAELSAGREPGRASVRVVNPVLEQDGWTSGHTFVQVVTDDMPFLVDSVLGELARHELSVHQLFHPQVVLDAADGTLLDVEPRDVGPGQRTESWMLIEVDRVPQEDRREALRADLERVLADVRRAIEDWHAMRQRARALIAELELAPPHTVDQSTVKPTVDFLSWLDDHHFTYLGYRSYDLVEQDGQAALRSVPGSGLGILRDQEGSPASVSLLRPEAALTAREPRLLTVTKANTRATVHRPVPLDYIGVRRFDREGRVIGEQRFLGLFTQGAYAESTTRLPIVGTKVKHILEHSGYAPDSHSGKDLISVLEAYPRDELFQAPVEHLEASAQEVMRLLERPAARVFTRRDEFGRFVSALVFLPRDRYTTASRLRVQHLLEETFGGELSDYATRVSDGPLAQLHFVIRLPRDREVPTVDEARLQERLSAVTRTWVEGLTEAVASQVQDEAAVGDLVAHYADAFPEAYKEDFDGATAYVDLARLADLQGPAGAARPASTARRATTRRSAGSRSTAGRRCPSPTCCRSSRTSAWR